MRAPNAAPILAAVAFVATLSTVADAQVKWQRMSGLCGGLVTTILEDKEGRLYAASGALFSGGATFRSDDHGLSWARCPPDSAGGFAGATIIGDNDYVYTGNEGIRCSHDHGETWIAPFAPKNGPFLPPVHALAFNRFGEVFVGTSGNGRDEGAMYTFVNDSVWGTYWAEVLGWDWHGNWGVEKLLIKPTGEMFASMSVEGMYRSTDDGGGWEWVSGGPDTLQIWAMTDGPGGEIFAGSRNGILLRSSDNGTTWGSSKIVPIDSAITDVLCLSESNIFLATNGQGIFHSLDSGRRWQAADSGMEDMQVNVLHQDTISGYLFAGTAIHGIYRSTDRGQSWHLSNTGLTITSRVEISATRGNTIFAATQGAGVFRSRDTGNTWETADNGLPVFAERNWVYFAPNSFKGMVESPTGRLMMRSEVDYLTSDEYAANLFTSTNGGEQWEWIHTPPAPYLSLQAVSCIAFTAQGRLLIGTEFTGAFASSDNGGTWEALSGPWDTVELGDRAIFSMLVLPSGDYLAATDMGVLRSSDSGKNWQASGGWKGPLAFVGQMVTDGHGTVYEIDNIDGITRSRDDGRSWDTVNGGLPSIYIRSIMTFGQAVYASDGQHGVYGSSNHGQTWEAINDGLSALDISSLAADSLGHLYAWSRSNGLYRTTQPIVVGVSGRGQSELPRKYALLQNYPNPFNPSTIISYQIPRSGFVSLKIYNLLGQEIETLVNEEKQPGEYKVRWDGAGVPSGVYFYTMSAGSYRETRKLLLLK